MQAYLALCTLCMAYAQFSDFTRFPHRGSSVNQSILYFFVRIALNNIPFIPHCGHRLFPSSCHALCMVNDNGVRRQRRPPHIH